jgi:hypothetical protein
MHVRNGTGTTLPRKGDRYAYRQALLAKISRNSLRWTLRLSRFACDGDADDLAIGLASLRDRHATSTALYHVLCDPVLWMHVAQ